MGVVSTGGLLTVTLSTVFVPTNLPNLTVWWNANNSGSITQSGGLVSQLNDLSGNGYHFVQNTGSKQPITGTRTVFGKNGLDFDGTDDTMQVAAGPSLSLPFTCFGIFHFDLPNTEATSRRFIQHVGGAYEFNYAATGQWGTNAGALITGGASDNNDGYYVVQVASGTNNIVLRVNGSQIGTGTYGQGNPTGAGSWGLGSNASGTTNFWNGIIKEAGVYSSLISGSDLTTLETYLAAGGA